MASLLIFCFLLHCLRVGNARFLLHVRTDFLHQFAAHLIEAARSRGMAAFELQDVIAELALHDAAQLSWLGQGKCRLVKFGNHLSSLKEAQITALRGTALVRGTLLGQLREVRAALEFLLDLLDLRTGIRPLACNQDVPHLHLLRYLEAFRLGLVDIAGQTFGSRVRKHVVLVHLGQVGIGQHLVARYTQCSRDLWILLQSSSFGALRHGATCIQVGRDLGHCLWTGQHRIAHFRRHAQCIGPHIAAVDRDVRPLDQHGFLGMGRQHQCGEHGTGAEAESGTFHVGVNHR